MFSQILLQSLCLLVCEATEASGLYLQSFVCLPLELFNYYKATILWRCSRHLQSINNPELTNPSKSEYLLFSTTKQHIWPFWDIFSVYVSKQAVAGSHSNFFLLIYFHLAPPSLLRETTKQNLPCSGTVKVITSLWGTIEEVHESSP